MTKGFELTKEEIKRLKETPVRQRRARARWIILLRYRHLLLEEEKLDFFTDLAIAAAKVK